MRAVLANSVRPRIGQAPSNLSFGRGTPIRRTAFPVSPRKLTLCDAFTILLAPVLTAAFVADITQKDRRRHEWDRKLAQILEEIEALREKELQSWETLQLRSVQAGVIQQRRYHSTTTTTVTRAHDNEETPPTTEGFSGEYVSNLQSYENFLATKVGLQLLLHICTGRDPTSKLGMEGLSDGTIIPDSLEALITHLRRVNDGLRMLSRQLPTGTADDLLDTDERRELDIHVAKLTWQCRTGKISVNELIYGYTQAVMSSRTGLSLHVYRKLVETFSTLDADVLTFIAMFPYLNTRQNLYDRIIVSIINQYGKVRDPGRLDSFLQKLLQPERPFSTMTKWEPLVVDGVRVPAPVNRRPRLLDMLVRTALQVDQPHKARAWATLLMQQEISVHRLAALFNNFLTYSAKHLNWKWGLLWMQKAIAWAALFAERSPEMLQKLIFRMLDLCRCCNQDQLYNDILNAAVIAGLDVPPLDATRPDSLAEQARAIRDDWTLRIKQSQVLQKGSSEALEAAKIFQHEMAHVDSAIQSFIGVTDLDRLRALTQTQEEHSDQPWHDKLHLLKPDEMLTPNSRPQIQAFFEPWSEWNLSHVENELDPYTNNSNGIRNRQNSDSEAHISKLQREVEMNNEVADLVDTAYLSNHSGHSSDSDLQDLARKLLRFQKRDVQYANHISHLTEELESLKTHVSELSTQLEASNEKEAELLKLNNQLKIQIDAVKRKSLEQVFLERENYNMRLDLKELTARHTSILSGMKYAEKEASTLRAQYQRLEEHSVTKMDSLRQENKALRRELDTTTSQHRKLVGDSRARQGRLTKLLNILEERAKDSGAEQSNLKPASQTPSFRAESAQKSPSEGNDQYGLDSADQKERINLKFLQD